MNKIRKLVTIMLAVVLMFSIAAIPASALGYTNHTSQRSYLAFQSDWEYTRTYKVGSTVIGYMVYGFDTVLVDEDYTWTLSTECYSKAGVMRDGYDTDYKCGKEQGKNTYSKIEVTHKTYYVYYQIEFTATYSNVSWTTSSSAVK